MSKAGNEIINERRIVSDCAALIEVKGHSISVVDIVTGHFKVDDRPLRPDLDTPNKARSTAWANTIRDGVVGYVEIAHVGQIELTAIIRVAVGLDPLPSIVICIEDVACNRIVAWLSSEYALKGHGIGSCSRKNRFSHENVLAEGVGIIGSISYIEADDSGI